MNYQSFHVTIITADNKESYTAVFMTKDAALKYIDEMTAKGNTASISVIG